jgi:hypothetical protein
MARQSWVRTVLGTPLTAHAPYTALICGSAFDSHKAMKEIDWSLKGGIWSASLSLTMLNWMQDMSITQEKGSLFSIRHFRQLFHLSPLAYWLLDQILHWLTHEGLGKERLCKSVQVYFVLGKDSFVKKYYAKFTKNITGELLLLWISCSRVICDNVYESWLLHVLTYINNLLFIYIYKEEWI